MSEKIIVRQNKKFKIGLWAVNPDKPDSDDYQPVHGPHEVTPYGMMLISLAACSAQVVITYAQYHEGKLEDVDFHLSYEYFWLPITAP